MISKRILIEGAAQRSGDRIQSVELFRAEVADDVDREDAIGNESIKWVYKGNLVRDNIRAICENHSISSDIDDVAQFIYQNYGEWFGWCNGDPADALEEIRGYLAGIMFLEGGT